MHNDSPSKLIWVCVIRIAECCHNVEILHIAGCSNMASIGIIRIAHFVLIKRTWVWERWMSMRRWKDITDSRIVRIAECCSSIKKLNLTGRCVIPERSVIRIAECLHHINFFSIAFCDNVTDTSVIRIVECSHHIKAQVIAQYSTIIDTSIIKITECCHRRQFWCN